MLSESLNTPWKVIVHLKRIIQSPFIWFYFFFHGIKLAPGWRIFGFPIIQKHRKSIIEAGPGLQLRSTVHSNPFGTNHPVILGTLAADSMIIIGKNFGMSGGSVIAADKILIGDNVVVGANTFIADTDFHPISLREREIDPEKGKTAPVIIESDVFIGANCLILKGVTIGKGSLIGGGSVVTKSVPAGMIAAGNPAKVIRSIEENETLNK